MRSICLALVVV